MKNKNLKIKKLMAPVRIDFGGGTTDISPFKDKYGGCVLNAAINRYVVGELVVDDKKTHLEYTGNIPTSSGLGTSGVMNLIWLSLILQKGESFDSNYKTKLAETVYKFEQAMGLVGGKQDQYAGAFGGINFMEFKKDKVNVERLNLSEKFIKKLEDKLVLVYTGKPHFSGSSNGSVIDNLRKGKNNSNLLRIKKIAIEMKHALLNEDLERFAELMNEETGERKKLHKSIVPESTQKIIAVGMENGAVAAKVCGSGGGGCILFFGDKQKLKQKFKDKIIDFKFDFEGLRVLK
jgi:D-glycero-alpha-D-manno-heptose-7-phosphate kinase